MLDKNEEAASSASKPPKTPEELAEIAYLDRLRSGEGEERPERLPLACIVKVVGYEEVPKANDKYAMVTVQGPEGRKWRMCIYRYSARRVRPQWWSKSGGVDVVESNLSFN